MKQKHFSVLIIVLFVLAGIYFAGGLFEQEVADDQVVLLLKGVKADEVSAVKIEQGEEVVDLKLNQDVWGVEQRAHYLADLGKIRAMLLKLFELKSSQLITKNPKNHVALGVDESSVKSGKAKVSVFDKAGTKTAGLILGENRTASGDVSAPFAAGQYVRLDNRDEVYLITSQVSVSLDIGNWLDNNLANVLSSKVRAITQYKSEKNGQTLQYEITKDSLAKEKRFVLVKPKLKSDQIQESSITQISTGLEGLKLEDVYKHDDQVLSEILFDYKTVYQLSNGLEYAVLSAEKDERYYAKIEVNFVEELAEQIKKEAEEAKKQADAVTEKSEEEQSEQAAEIAKPEPVEISSVDEAKKLQAQYQSWVYRLPAYIGKKFRLSKSDLIVKNEED